MQSRPHQQVALLVRVRALVEGTRRAQSLARSPESITILVRAKGLIWPVSGALIDENKGHHLEDARSQKVS